MPIDYPSFQRTLQVEATRSEQDATKAFESFVKETSDTMQAKGKDIVNKSQNKAKAEADLVDAKKDKAGVVLELQQLSNGNAELHQSCLSGAQAQFELDNEARLSMSWVAHPCHAHALVILFVFKSCL